MRSVSPESSLEKARAALLSKFAETRINRHGFVEVHLLVVDADKNSEYWPMSMFLKESVDREYAAQQVKECMVAYAASAVALEREQCAQIAERFKQPLIADEIRASREAKGRR